MIQMQQLRLTPKPQAACCQTEAEYWIVAAVTENSRWTQYRHLMYPRCVYLFRNNHRTPTTRSLSWTRHSSRVTLWLTKIILHTLQNFNCGVQRRVTHNPATRQLLNNGKRRNHFAGPRGPALISHISSLVCHSLCRRPCQPASTDGHINTLKRRAYELRAFTHIELSSSSPLLFLFPPKEDRE
jgi:hypothetical protein